MNDKQQRRSIIRNTALISVFAAASLIGAKMGTPIQEPRMCESTPRTEMTYKIKSMIDSAPDKEYASRYVLSTLNTKSDKVLEFDFEVVSLLSKLGTSGNNMYFALVQIEGSPPERTYKLGREPTSVELDKLSNITKRAPEIFNNNGHYGYTYESQGNTLKLIVSY